MKNGVNGCLLPDGTLSGVWSQQGDSHEDDGSDGGEELVVRADWLADRERLVDHVVSELGRAIDGARSPSDVQLIKIKLVAVLESSG